MSQPDGTCQCEDAAFIYEEAEILGRAADNACLRLHCCEIAATACSNPSTTRLSRLGLKREQERARMPRRWKPRSSFF